MTPAKSRQSGSAAPSARSARSSPIPRSISTPEYSAGGSQSTCCRTSMTWGDVAKATCQGGVVRCVRSITRSRYFVGMDENRVRRVVDALRERGIDAHQLRAGVDQFGVRVVLHDSREAEWDTDDTAG